jgi:hypothetical protein
VNRVVAVAAVAFVVASCGSGSRSHRAVLDGSPRFPDAEGVVTAVSVDKITLDGTHTYKVSPHLQSFSTYTLETVPLLGRKSQYVQVGLDGDTMVWLASVGAVVRAPNLPPTVFYVGHLARVDGQHRAIFHDGTVFRLGSDVRALTGADVVRVELDPVSHVARRMVLP